VMIYQELFHKKKCKVMRENDSVIGLDIEDKFVSTVDQQEEIIATGSSSTGIVCLVQATRIHLARFWEGLKR